MLLGGVRCFGKGKEEAIARRAFACTVERLEPGIKSSKLPPGRCSDSCVRGLIVSPSGADSIASSDVPLTVTSRHGSCTVGYGFGIALAACVMFFAPSQ